MRVALVVFGTLDQPSGGYLYDRYLTDGLRAAGHDVHIVSQPSGLSYRQQRRLGGEPAGAAAAIHHLSPDLLIVDELNHAAVTPWLPDLQTALPSMVTVGLVHHLRSDEGGIAGLARRRERTFLQRCDAWICNSGPTLARVRRVSGVERSSAVVHPGGETAGYRAGGDAAGGMGVATTRYGPSDEATALDVTTTCRRPPLHEAGSPAARGTWSRDGGLQLLSVGSLIPRKNVHLLIRAVAAFPGVHLSVVGDPTVDPSYTKRLRREIAARHLEERVVLRGRLSPAELEEEYRRADVMALPSRYEGFGIVFLEALARGVPVVAPRTGGVLDIVTPGVEGVLVRPGSVSALRRVVREIIEEPDRLDEMGAAGRRRADRFHSWSRTMAGAVSFLETVARRERPS